MARRLLLGAVITFGFLVVMSPWWIRNDRIFGRFVPTALWTGASLYDGLNLRANGGSDMSFMSDEAIWPLDEVDQDKALTQKAIAFARAEPLRVVQLAILKFGRYWRPWPDAVGFRSIWLAILSGAGTIPLFGLIALGGWTVKNDLRAIVILAGPLLYFCGLHLAFASSMRYRIPGEVPALGLAAIGIFRLTDWCGWRSESSSI
jgi:hypothetical protein